MRLRTNGPRIPLETIVTPSNALERPANSGVVITTTPPVGALPENSNSRSLDLNARRFAPQAPVIAHVPITDAVSLTADAESESSRDGLVRLVSKLRNRTAIDLPVDIILKAIRTQAELLERDLSELNAAVFKHRILAPHPPSLRQLKRELAVSFQRISQIEELLVRKLLNRVRLNLTRPRDLANLSLEDTNLPRRAVNLLRLHRIYTYADLRNQPPEFFRSIKKLGPASWKAIEALRKSENL